MALIRTITLAVLACLAVAVPWVGAAPAQAAAGVDAQAAAAHAAAHGYRTGVAVLDLATGAYTGAGDDAGLFPSESVVKVLIATQLLLSGQMNGPTEALARSMISASDDAAADRLYVLAGGEAVLPSVAAHYGVPGLGAPTSTPGRWGLTQITAKGLVQLYAAVAHDPTVSPWLSDAMGQASATAADGTAQLFGLPAAAPDAVIKQGWGHDGVGGGQAVANSTGYVVGGRFAVAILTEGPPSSYLAGIAAEVSAQAQALLAGVVPAAAPAAPPVPAVTPVAPGRKPVDVRPLLVSLAGLAAAAAAGYGGVLVLRRARTALEARRERRRARATEQRRRRALAAAARNGATVVRLPDGRLVRLTGRRPSGPRPAGGRSSAPTAARLRAVATSAPAAARAA